MDPLLLQKVEEGKGLSHVPQPRSRPSREVGRPLELTRGSVLAERLEDNLAHHYRYQSPRFFSGIRPVGTNIAYAFLKQFSHSHNPAAIGSGGKGEEAIPSESVAKLSQDTELEMVG